MTFGLDRHALLQSRFLRFCVAGAVGFIVDGGLVQLLVGIFGLDPVLMRFVSFTVAVTVTWQINRTLTFPDAARRSPAAQWLQYVLANGIGATANLLIYTLLVINIPFLTKWPIIAVFAGAIVALAINFTLSARLVFRAPATMTTIDKRRTRRLVIIVLALVAATVMWGGTIKTWQPVADETQYLAYAYNLFHHGTYSQAGAHAPRVPSADREPGYPAFITLMMAFDPVLRGFSPDCLTGRGETLCAAETYRSLQWANAVFVALAALFTGLTANALTGSFGAGLVAGGAVVLNLTALSWRYTVLSDYLALMLAALLAWLFVAATRRSGPIPWIAAGLTAAGLTLTKAVFLYFLVLAAIVFTVVLAWRWKSPAAKQLRHAGLAFFLAALIPVLGWMSVNKAATGHFGITDGTRMGVVLSVREIYNDMTAKEWATSFLWWTRGFGDNLARRHLPDEYTARLHDSAPGGFYQRGHDRFYEMRDALMREKGLSKESAETAVTSDIFDRILARPFTHAATTLPLFYRGIWIDEFIVLSLPALIFVLMIAWRRQDAVLAVALTPGIFSLLIYALASLNIPRYQLTAVPTLALALGIAFGLLRHRKGLPAGM